MKLKEYPKQSNDIGKYVQVLFKDDEDTKENCKLGIILRDDAYCTIIQLMNGNLVLSHEVKFRKITNNLNLEFFKGPIKPLSNYGEKL